MNITMTTILSRWDASTGGSRRDVPARNGMEVGVDQGDAKVDALLTAGQTAGTTEGAEA
jgi:hypothetical protein